MKLVLTALSLGLPLLLTVRATAQSPDEDFDSAVDAFFERYFEFYPTFAAGAGLHEYDPRLGPRDAASIRAWLTDWNERPKPFVWTKTADEILDKVAAYCHRISDSGH